MSSRPAAVLALVVAALAAGCPEVPAPVAPPSPAAPAAEPVVVRPSKNGLGFRVSDADPRDARPTPRPRTTPLSDADAKRVLDRLPAFGPDSSDEQSFALRDRSQPPPRPGKTIAEPFPPPAGPAPPPAQAAGAPLAITRRAPAGNVEMAPFLSVSFSLPMVAVTSVADLERTPPPVVLTPEPKGKWRWVGAQTVVFDPDKRFPMATEYTVKVPAGARAANGQALAREETWTFATPPPKVLTMVPRGGPQKLDPLFYAELDQAVDRDAVLAAVQLTGGGGRVPIRAATEAEIDADVAVRRLADKAQAGRWIAFKAQAPLARGTSYEVVFPPGMPSAEGPRRTEKEQRFELHTYHPFHVEEARCGWGNCPPGAPFTIQLNNPIDEGTFDRSMVRVSPEPEGLRVTAAGRNITVQGRTRGKTKYKVTVAGALGDVFGQKLGEDATREIAVQPADPMLFAEDGEMSVLDPSGSPALPVFSVNRARVDVKLYAVTPEDWPRYQEWRSAWDSEYKTTAPPGRLVATRAVRPAQKPDELTVTPIDLAPALQDGSGQVVVVVEPPGPIPKERWRRQWVRAWVQVTRLGLETFVDDQHLVAWTTRLADGAPESGVEVAVTKVAGTGSTARGTTGADGLARVDLLDAEQAVVVARKGADLAMLPGGHVGSLSARSQADLVRWFVFDDRRIYKPGEEVHVKGWIRRIGTNLGGDVGLVPGAAGRTIDWTSKDSQGIEIGKGTATVDASGGFDFAWKLPATPNLGGAIVHLALPHAGLAGDAHDHAFSIEEFRRPEFEVGARAGEGPFLVGGHTDVTASATYYAGGGLPGAPVAWSIRREDAVFVPPNRGEYAFGKAHEPWWIEPLGKATSNIETWTGFTGASGEHRVRLDFDALEPSYPMSLACEATITDVNRQAWSARTSLLVHPADVYVGVKQERAFVRAGDALPVEIVVTDLDGKLVPGRPVTVKSARVEYRWEKGERVAVELDADACTVTSAAEAQRCSLRTKEGGRYKVTAIVTDAAGRRNQTETHLWVMAPGAQPDGALARGEVRVIPSKTSYQAGETAELLLVAPFAPAEGVLSIERQGMVHVGRFRLASATETVRFTVERAWTPNVNARVLLLGAATREDDRGVADPRLPKRPAFASGSVALDVPPRDRTLDVKVTPRDAKLDPGGSTEIDVDVRDASGAAVSGSSVAVMVVDEAVLALSAYKTPDPVADFYFHREPGTREAGTYAHVLVARPEDKQLESRGGRSTKDGRRYKAYRLPDFDLDQRAVIGGAIPMPEDVTAMPMAKAAAMPGGEKPGLAGESGPPKPIAVRKDLAALALFAPALPTDARGHASFALKLPDSVTRYRVMAIAVAGEQKFGSAESSVTARLPLMVRPSAPRFLNFGDRFDLPVVVQNQTDAPIEVDVAARAANAVLTAGAGRRVTVPANDRAEVLLPAAAARPGKARFQIGAASARYADAAEIALPVWTPATTEAFATYGVVDEGAIAQPVKMPAGVEPSFGGVEITTSSTALSALTDAVLYLVRYPFECNEQVSSRVMAVAALRDVLEAFAAKDLPPRQVLVDSVARDLARLAARQHWSGGWSFWDADREPWPYLSIHVAHAIQRAQEKGFAVDRGMLSKSQRYLRGIERQVAGWYSKEARLSIVAYALYVRKRMGDADPDRARQLVEEAGGADKLPLEAVGWIWPVLAADPKAERLVADIRRVVQNRATETAGAAHFTTSYDDGAYVLLHSDRRADAILLEALVGDQPKSDLIPKLVTGLLAHKKAGRWASTQENAFVLLALDRYFSAYEKATPDFVARAWLGDRYAGEQTFKGRNGDRREIDIPMRALAEVGGGDVVLQKTGAGRLYYRVGVTYAPADLRPPPVERGFTVTRVYESVDDPGDVRRDAEGVWHVKAGAKVRVRLSLVAPSRRYHVALVDPLPAGLEPMNPALAVTGTVPPDPKAPPSPGWWWRAAWYEHQNMRDERVEAFTPLLWDGVYDYTYVARATTPGSFVAPPPKAEEMYSPETFGRGAGDRVVVE